MKKIAKMAMLIGGLLAFSACEKDMPEYDGVDGLYFDVQYTNTPWYTNPDLWAHQIYSLVKFSLMEKSDTVLNLKVAAVGRARDYDRPFQIQVVNDSTTVSAGDEYEILESSGVIKAGATSGTVAVKIKKSERMADQLLQLQVALVENEYFRLPYDKLAVVPGRYSEDLTLYSSNSDPRIHNIFITDILMKPKYWSPSFGVYSPGKFRLMLELYPDAPAIAYEYSDTMPTSLMNVISELGARYLQRMADAGTPVLEDDGTLMWMKGVAWGQGSKPEDLKTKN